LDGYLNNINKITFVIIIKIVIITLAELSLRATIRGFDITPSNEQATINQIYAFYSDLYDIYSSETD
jgi:hypothetical protein